MTEELEDDSEELWCGFLTGNIGMVTVEELKDHLDGCAGCRKNLTEEFHLYSLNSESSILFTSKLEIKRGITSEEEFLGFD